VVDGDAVVDLAPLAAEVGTSLKAALEKGALPAIAAWVSGERERLALKDVELLPVVPDPEKILCVGINYLSHVKETGREIPRHPMIFSRWADSQTAHGGPIVRPLVSEKLDFEGELAIVIGKTARHVKREDAMDVVAGYACYNDGSVRDWQSHTHQFTPGKNFPGTGGFGPWMMTPEELGPLGARRIRTRLNDQVVQDASLGEMIFDVPTILEYCSSFTRLECGDVIATGTPGGVGAKRTPPLWMKPGDVVEVEIEGLGTLHNGIAQES
jgi:2-keto-4-pentenoate hydratase/2-oxohepta-3-ene-1,7-dioic acid hydratase in catechol pathway